VTDPLTDVEQVLAVDAERCRALLAKDVATLERITADDYTHVETNGGIRSKAQFLSLMGNPDLVFTSWVIEENHVRVYGATAVVTGRYHNTVRTAAGEQPPKHARHIRVYRRSADGSWQNVAHQATRLEPVPPRP
jgi:ketosteroid isomerase-like protein